MDVINGKLSKRKQKNKSKNKFSYSNDTKGSSDDIIYNCEDIFSTYNKGNNNISLTDF